MQLHDVITTDMHVHVHVHVHESLASLSSTIDLSHMGYKTFQMAVMYMYMGVYNVQCTYILMFRFVCSRRVCLESGAAVDTRSGHSAGSGS